MIKSLLGLGLLTVVNVLPARAGGWNHLAGQPCKSDDYSTKRDVPEGWEICDTDYRTRLRCNKEGDNLVLRAIVEAPQCTDKQLCWPPTFYPLQGPVETGKTRCIDGKPPKGFDGDWACKHDTKRSFFEHGCDASNEWKWQCFTANPQSDEKGEWEELRVCKNCRTDPAKAGEVLCDMEEQEKWEPWYPVDKYQEVLHKAPPPLDEAGNSQCEIDITKCRSEPFIKYT